VFFALTPMTAIQWASAVMFLRCLSVANRMGEEAFRTVMARRYSWEEEDEWP